MAQLEQLCIVGTSWRWGSSLRLAQLTIAPEDRPERLLRLAETLGVDEALYLATCNRVEVVVVLPSGVSPADARRLVFEELVGREPLEGEAERALRVWAGESAAEHLFVVAAGLDSAQIGEREIRGQLREAQEVSESQGLMGDLLRRSIVAALRTARRAHEETGVGDGRTSLAEIALEVLLRQCRSADAQAGEKARIALVGVSAMTRYCAGRLKEELPRGDVLVVNRTLERAQELADQIGATVSSFESFQSGEVSASIVLSSTAATSTVVSGDALDAMERSCCEPLVIDMAIPADADEALCRRHSVRYVGMDEVSRLADEGRAFRQRQSAAARELVDSGLDRLLGELGTRSIAPVLEGLGELYRRTALDQLERLQREGFELTEEQRGRLEEWALHLAGRLAHVPTKGLRALAAASETDAVERFLVASANDLVERLPQRRRDVAKSEGAGSS